MKLNLQRALAAKLLRIGKSKVKLNPEAREDLKAAITKADVAGLISKGAITLVKIKGTSRHRARARHVQRKKGRQRGYGKRKGTQNSRTPSKRSWINKIRIQRATLKGLKNKDKLTSTNYRMLYLKAKGGFFRSKKHLLQYIEQHNMLRRHHK